MKKAGLVLFWTAVIWTIFWGVIVTIIRKPAISSLTLDELNQTIWAIYGPVGLMYGVLSNLLGVLVAGIGILMYSGAKGLTVLKFGVITLLGFILALGTMMLGRIPVLFGIGGTLILLAFFGILWFWAKERMDLKDSSTAATDLKLVGYVFMLMAAWWACQVTGVPYAKAAQELPQVSPIHLMIFLVLGWIFLFLSHYKSHTDKKKKKT